MASSQTGQLFVDSSTYKSARKKFDFNEPDFRQFKGMKEPMPVYEVKGLKQSSQSPQTKELKPIVGRGDEIATIEMVIEGVLNSEIQTVLHQGEPGIGKTRLSAEFSKLYDNSGFISVTGEAISYAKKNTILGLEFYSA